MQPATLSPSQNNTLKQFVTAFLPPRGNKRKNTRNELARVHATLHRVFLRYFGFGVTRQQVFDAFEELGYTLFTRKGTWHPEKKDWVPSATGDTTKGGTMYEDHDAAFIYIDIEAPAVQQLWLTTLALSGDTNPEKLAQRERLVELITAFKLQMEGTEA